MSDAMTNAFNQWNKMLIDQTQWDARRESANQDFAIRSLQAVNEAQNAAQVRKIRQAQLDEIEFNNQQVGLKAGKLFNASDPDQVAWFKKNQGNIANNFTQMPGSYFDTSSENPDDWQLMAPDGTPFQMARKRYRPKYLSYAYKAAANFSADPIPLYEQQLQSAQDNLDEIQGLRNSVRSAVTQAKQPHELAKLKVIENKRKAKRDRISNLVNTRDGQRLLLANQRKRLEDMRAEVLAAGGDPSTVNQAFNDALDTIAQRQAMIEGGAEGKTEMERAWMRENARRQYVGLNPMSLAQFKNNIWNPQNPDKDSDFKFAYNEWKAGGFRDPQTGEVVPPQNRNSAFFRQNYYLTQRDITPQGAMSAFENLWYQLPGDIQEDLQSKNLTFADASKAVSDLMKADPTLSREEAFYKVYGEIRSKNYAALSRAAKGQPAYEPRRRTPAGGGSGANLTKKQRLDLAGKIKAGVKSGKIPTTKRNGRDAVRHAPSNTWFVKNDQGNWVPEDQIKESKPTSADSYSRAKGMNPGGSTEMKRFGYYKRNRKELSRTNLKRRDNLH